MAGSRALWNWFIANLGRVDTDEGQQTLTQLLHEIGVTSWEMGVQEGDRFLAFSVASVDDVTTVRAIVADAPRVPGWRFLVGKPKKDWSRFFVWQGIEVDASEWRCVVFTYDDGISEIVFIDPIIPDALGEFTQQILEFVVESELGQLCALERIFRVTAESLAGEVRAEDAMPVWKLSSAI